MKAEKDIQKKIKQKEEEIQRLKESLYKAEAYVEALQESLRLIKRVSSENGQGLIRPGSMVHKAQLALRHAGKPLRVEELLRSMGKEINKKNKVSLSGSLGSYVRDESIFNRPAPNTFGLIEFNESEDEDIPESFGLNED